MKQRANEFQLRKIMTKVIHIMVTTDKTQREIARELEINEVTISRWKKHPIWIEIWNNAMKEYYSSNQIN